MRKISNNRKRTKGRIVHQFPIKENVEVEKDIIIIKKIKGVFKKVKLGVKTIHYQKRTAKHFRSIPD